LRFQAWTFVFLPYFWLPEVEQVTRHQAAEKSPADLADEAFEFALVYPYSSATAAAIENESVQYIGVQKAGAFWTTQIVAGLLNSFQIIAKLSEQLSITFCEMDIPSWPLCKSHHISEAIIFDLHKVTAPGAEPPSA
jgi:hypothetical protein